MISSCLPEPSAPSFNLLVISRWCSFAVSIRWHGVHRVLKLSIPVPPPPSATAVMWSACQKSCSSGSRRNRSRFVEGSFQLAFNNVFSLSAGCNVFIRQNNACASILQSWHTPLREKRAIKWVLWDKITRWKQPVTYRSSSNKAARIFVEEYMFPRRTLPSSAHFHEQ